MIFYECTIRFDDKVKQRKVGVWGVERLDEPNPVSMNSPGAMKRFSILKGTVHRSLLFDNENVTCDRYQNMLINFMFLQFRFLQEEYVSSSTVPLQPIQAELQLI